VTFEAKNVLAHCCGEEPMTNQSLHNSPRLCLKESVSFSSPPHRMSD
jgi:hypothetical protein